MIDTLLPNKFATRACEFDPSISVRFLNESDFEYEIFEPIFEEYGYSVSLIKQNLIVFDSKALQELKITPYEIDFIEAHEYSHFKLGEGATEVDCDWLAIANLWVKNKKLSAKAGIDLFEERNGMSFDISDLDGYGAWEKRCRIDSRTFLEECEALQIEPIKVLKSPESYLDQFESIDRFNKKTIIAYAWDEYINLLTT